jgi:RND family efflux transporter MFP subunit
MKTRSVGRSYLLLFLVCLTAWLNSCTKAGRAGALGPEAAKVASAAVVKVSREDLSRERTMMAEFRPYQEIDVHAKVAGYLKQIFVDVGDQVKKGQLLAVLEIPELKAEADQAEAAESRNQEEIKRAESEVRRAEAAYEEAHITYSRLASVVKLKPRLIAEQEVDQAKARDRVAAAQVDTAKAAVAVAKQKLLEEKASGERVKSLIAYTRIEAPFSGVITRRYADVGAMIPAGTSTSTQAMPIVKLSQADQLRLVLPVPESIVPSVKTGATVNIKVQSLDRVFPGTVSRLTDKVDTATRTMEVEVDVPNPSRVLKPGMYASASLTLEQTTGVLTVPVEALTISDKKTSVLVVNDQGVIEEREVTTGIETASKVAVVRGLKEGEFVVVGSKAQFRPGERVQPKLEQMTAEVKGAP